MEIQVLEQLNRAVGQTGMGLPQVFTTIHHHNGRISVQSEIGKGTTFHISLPIQNKTYTE